ncbi:MAG: PucR family transcriptional regulator [Lachnospiraceae bacterium]|nr:PucR family transcriptional regulator [Lachnospiraceae bacterium]
MAVTCKDIMELNSCRRLKLVGGAEGLDKVVSWPYIKSMDTISKWIHGGELIFVLGVKDDTSERGFLSLMDEAVKNNISGMVVLCGDEYVRSIPKMVIKYANDYKIPLFKMPFMLKLIDITQDISKYILNDLVIQKQNREFSGNSVMELMLKGKSMDEILNYCFMKLQPIVEADKVLKTEYVKTLRIYLECNNDQLHTSQQMYIHRNTMINRMKKINSLLGTNVNDAEIRNDFNNIFKVLDYCGKLEKE